MRDVSRVANRDGSQSLAPSGDLTDGMCRTMYIPASL